MNKNHFYRFIILPFIVLALFTPLYMYFSHDVAELRTEYPHNIQPGEAEADYVLKPERPRNWSALKNISPYAFKAIVLSEDWSFYDHQGIDVEQMKVAFEDILSGTRFRGASTITQQMVKNVYLSQSRTPWRKLHEIILAQKVEKVLSKNKILEIYLNCIEFGPSIFGITAASLHYFKKMPANLSPRESAFLAMLLPSPKRYYVSFKKKRLTKFARSRIKAILKKMRMGKAISSEQYDWELDQTFSWETN